MAVVSFPKDLDRLKKSLEWFGQPTAVCVICVLLCICHERITC